MLKNASNFVVACVTLIFVAAIAGGVILIVDGKETLSTIVSGIAALASALSLLYASAGANSAHNADEQTNGKLKDAMNVAIQTALMTHDTMVHGVVPQLPPPLLATPPPSTVEEGSNGTGQ